MDEEIDPAVARLLADLEERIAVIEAARADLDLVEAERTKLSLGARLWSSLEARVRVVFDGAEAVSGTLVDCSATWLHVTRDGGQDCFGALARVASIEGLGRASRVARRVDARRGWGFVLRRCGTRGLPVRIVAGGQWLTGTVRAVARDHLDLLADSGCEHAVRYDAIVRVETRGWQL